ncbi:site-specific DNA-methyltransferase [Turicibacter sanguinis]|uniref:site-specific DNA-methyltransferase n=1 Tax=Turicibacter sanguinis TaxID=154288 RepID=UPI00241BF5DE|nr:site-specific DNA-methyltransferase [Turicibacter sanguinis]
MEKMTGESLDLTQENVKRLKELFPEVLTEKKIDFDKLRLILGDEVETSPERYEFRWNGKNEAIKLSQTPSMGTLRPDKESSKNWDTTENLYIEGDNLEVLKLLQKSYFGKIKMIYIDPPYNTGKDFVYKDNFHDNIANYKEITNQSTKANPETSGRFHTDWLNMMYPRLRLARNLLKEDGVIFISIDDKEINNLKKICDEIFGDGNFRNQIIISRNTSDQTEYVSSLNTEKEYVLVYSKNINFSYNTAIIDFDKNGLDILSYLINTNSPKKYQEEIYKKYKLSSMKSEWKGFYTAKESRPSMQYEINGVVPYGEDNPNRRWIWGKERALQAVENYNEFCRLFPDSSEEELNKYISKTGIKDFVRKNKNNTIQYYKNGKSGTVIGDNWSEINTGQGSNSIKELFQKNYFDNPKPLDLIKRIMEITLFEDEIILDFFSGSGTTAQSVMNFNASRNMHHKFIMVQVPEKIEEKNEAYKDGYINICNIAKERIRRAGDKVLRESCNNKDLDIGFKVFKLDDSNIKTWDPNTNDLEHTLFNSVQNLKENRTQEDLLYELMLKMGIELTANIEEINVGGKILYNIQSGGLVICLENEITKDVIDVILTLKTPFMDMKVVFKEYGFKSDAEKLNAIQNLKQHGIKDVRSV